MRQIFAFRLGLLLLGLLAVSGIAWAATQQPSPQKATSADNKVGYGDALVLGLVEGITEYLPVSSTGHLILADRVLKLDSEVPALDRNGNPVMFKSHGVERVFTQKDAADGYAIIIQFGAILAVLGLYRAHIVEILAGLIGRSRKGLLLLRNLMIAFLPAAVLGKLLGDWISEKLFGPGPVVAALVAGAVLMLAVEAWRKRKIERGGSAALIEDEPPLHTLSPVQALFIGLMQCVALWPGTSRSMMTIVGGYFVGLAPRRAAEFSFLLGLVTLSAASLYKGLKVGPALIQTADVGPLLLGIVVATVSAALAVRWLVRWLTAHGLGLFAWYRLILAGLVLWLLGV